MPPSQALALRARIRPVQGLNASVYIQTVSNVAIPLENLLGSELIPGAQASYNATVTYFVEKQTGMIIDMTRNVTWNLITPKPSEIWYGLTASSPRTSGSSETTRSFTTG